MSYITFFFWLLLIYFPLDARHRVTECQEGSCVAWVGKSGDLSTSFLVFCCFDIKEHNCFCLLQLAYSMGCDGEGARRWMRWWPEGLKRALCL